MTSTSAPNNLTNAILSLQEAISCLKQGGIIGMPTETVYGLAADAHNEIAIRRVFEAKGRPGDHPVIVHIANVEQLTHWAINIPENAYTLAKAFWPGPMTLILQKHPSVSPLITGGQNTIALRVPAHPLALELLQNLGDGAGLIAPSANRFGHVSPTTAAHVLSDLGQSIDGIIDGGACDIGIESTIINLSGESPVILRPGIISATQIAEGLNSTEAELTKTPSITSNETPRVSGALKSHYAPKTPVFLATETTLFQSNSLLNHNDTVLCFSDTPLAINTPCQYLPQNPKQAASELYAMLRQIDSNAPKRLIVIMPPNTPDWAGLRDRLIRAASGKCLNTATEKENT